ncbi:MAG: hypothetical protein OIN85_00370 [Candidatus Methanoperedens sp.]|nr:hypothetical protein [Candidatus Methanoperedens sp.]
MVNNLFGERILIMGKKEINTCMYINQEMIFIPNLGLEDSVDWHVILSNTFWWLSLVLVAIAYRYRNIWKVGGTPWTFLFLTFLFFGIRELGHFSASPLIGSVRYIFGTWAAIFMSSALFSIYMRLCRKESGKMVTYTPFVLALLVPVVWFYGYSTAPGNLENFMLFNESLVWLIGGSITVYTTYMLGAQATGNFVKVFMLFQFSAFFAIIWKLLRLLELEGNPISYHVIESFETMFGVFAILAMLVLTQMLRKLSRQLYSHKS